MSEERVRHPPDLSSTRASRGSAHPGGVSGVLFERDLEASFGSSRSWTDAASGAGEVRQYSDARRFFPHHRWALSDHAALHRTGRRCRVAAASTQAHSAEPAPSAHCRAHRRAPAPTENVVQTLRRSALKIKGLRIPEPANCESSASNRDLFAVCEEIPHTDLAAAKAQLATLKAGLAKP